MDDLSDIPATRSMCRWIAMRSHARFAAANFYDPPIVMTDAELNAWTERLVAETWKDEAQ